MSRGLVLGFFLTSTAFALGIALVITTPAAKVPQKLPNQQKRFNQPCLFDPERGQVPDCVRTSANGSVVIAPEVRDDLNFSEQGLAPVWTSATGWMYVNRAGKVLITGVPVMDNWADSFHDGLVRFVTSGKYGFANREGKIVIAATYDGAMPFENGQAIVCHGCRSVSAPNDPEHHFFAGGEWFRVNNKGKIIGRMEAETH